MVDSCKAYFENEVSDVVQLPMNVDDLEGFIKDTVKSVNTMYTKQIKGDLEVTSEYSEELNQYLTLRSDELR